MKHEALNFTNFEFWVIISITMSDQNQNKIAGLEALLFYYGEPISVKKSSVLLEISTEECIVLIGELENKISGCVLDCLYVG